MKNLKIILVFVFLLSIISFAYSMDWNIQKDWLIESEVEEKARPIHLNVEGSDFSGDDGDFSRNYTLSVSQDLHIDSVYIDGWLILNPNDYTKSDDNKWIKMNSNQALYDSQTVTVVYYI